MKAYFISGLAADERVFNHIRLPAAIEMIPLRWIPHKRKEKLEEYAHRLAEEIDASKPFLLVGLSMGGMIAVEIAKIHPPAQLILISTVPTHLHFPPSFKLFRLLRLYALVPVKFLKAISIYKRDLLNDSAEDMDVLKRVIRDSDPAFIRWGMEAILRWRNIGIPLSAVHIHGSRDEILPLRYTNPTHIIKGAGHLMIMKRADEINRVLANVIRLND